MTGYKRVNYYELCRLCTSSQQKDKIHIFRDEGKKMQLQQKIQTCFPLLVCEQDYLPKVVCMSCVRILDVCFNFRQSCINSETMLSSYFSNFRFTDDFKKNGKVYVKDTGQKPPIQIAYIDSKNMKEEPLQNIKPNLHCEIPVFNLNTSLLKTLTCQTNKKNTIPITQNTNAVNVITPIPPEPVNIMKIEQTKPILTCPINLPTNNNNNNNVKTIEQISNEITNVLKSNQMMLIDMEQLMETGMESNDSKLREALLKPNVNETMEIVKKTKPVRSESKTTSTPKIYTCTICSKIFKRREHLYQHSKIHSCVRPFSCVHCPKTFSRKEHLMRHLTSHSGVKDFSCEVCNKKFSRPDNLKKHKKTHMKNPFRCEICTKNFVIKHYYLAHMQAHHGDNVKNDQITTKIEENDGNQTNIT